MGYDPTKDLSDIFGGGGANNVLPPPQVYSS